MYFWRVLLSVFDPSRAGLPDIHVSCEFFSPVLESMCFGAGDMSRQLGKGRSRRVQEDWNTQFGGNGLRDADPDLDERGFRNPRPGRVNFAPGACKTCTHIPPWESARLKSLCVGRRRCR